MIRLTSLRFVWVAALLLAGLGQVRAQEDTSSEPAPADEGTATASALPDQPKKPLEFAIPVSPAFDLLGVNPSTVMKPGMIRDFKVDWSFQSWRLKPNIALQGQPLWEAFYNRSSLKRYQRAPRLLRTLSTLDLSLGTLENDLQQRLVAGAIKLTLFRSTDPLNVPELYERLARSYADQDSTFYAERQLLEDSLWAIGKDPKRLQERFDLQTQLTDLATRQLEAERAHKAAMGEIAQKYMKENWNASFVDVAVGRSYTYDNAALDSLKLGQQGIAAWVNGSLGVGKRLLLSGLVRYGSLTTIDNPFDTTDRSVTTFQHLVGINLRYGSPRFNFFVEALTNSERHYFGPGNLTLAYGGDWRFSRNVMLSYAFRTVYSDKLEFKNVIPVAAISCMMR